MMLNELLGDQGFNKVMAMAGEVFIEDLRLNKRKDTDTAREHIRMRSMFLQVGKDQWIKQMLK